MIDITSINQNLDTLGFKNEYMAFQRAWNDGKRGVSSNGALSSFGTNITDCMLVGADGQAYVYLKPPNHDEKVGVTTAGEFVLGIKDGIPVTVTDVMNSLEERAGEFGFEHVKVGEFSDDQPVIVRFQNAFVNLKEGEAKVVPTHYSYQTLSNKRPRNLLVTGSAGGVQIQADKKGENPLYFLEHTNGKIEKHFYNVKASEAAVGTESKEGHEIGIRGMGKRTNVLCVMSIPNKTEPFVAPQYSSSGAHWDGTPVYRSLGASNFGESRAAILSADEKSVGTFDSGNPDFVYSGEPIVVTVLFYNTLEGGVAVSPRDIAMAVGDMEKAYKLCQNYGPLSQLPAMLEPMTKEAYAVIEKKLAVDPPGVKRPFVFDKDAAAKCIRDQTKC